MYRSTTRVALVQWMFVKSLMKKRFRKNRFEFDIDDQQIVRNTLLNRHRTSVPVRATTFVRGSTA
ncbi:MAG: hypothetical protein EA427_15950 [Spirochaetaceae bacterium]|nr:MAG: hypothetical protein EA427_15950 [Spirochaetaceae bacterium]